MGKIYTDCSEEVEPLADEILSQYHGEIAELDPDIGYFFVEYDSDTKEAAAKKRRELPPVLKLHGVACAATIKVNSYKDRVQGKPDVTVTINREAWEEYTDEQRRALLDHELTHLIPKLDKNGGPVADDLGRPEFKMRPHDYDLSGFGSVIRRHGKAAIEVKATVNFLTSEDGQMVMDFGGLKCLPASCESAVDGAGTMKPEVDLTQDRQFLKAARDLCPEGEGTVTVSVTPAPGQSWPDDVPKSVTLTSKTRERISEKLASNADADDLYAKAVEVVKGAGRGSVALLQRQLNIGYGRADRLIGAMVADGILEAETLPNSSGRALTKQAGDSAAA